MPVDDMVLSEQMRHRCILILSIAVTLVLQGVLAVAPHDHATFCTHGPAFELRSDADVPHHCLACSIHAPAAVAGGVSVVRSEIGAAPVETLRSVRAFAAAVESSRPRGPPRVS
jgi:hypothetical protein